MNIKKKSHAAKRKLRRKIKMKISSFLFVLMFIFWGMYHLLQSDLMNLKNIALEGNLYTDKNEIIDISGLVVNRNIFKYNLKEIKKNIKSHSYVKDAEIHRKLPDTIVMRIEERKEYAIILYMGSYIYIDDENTVLRVSDSYMADDNILITGIDFKNFKIGEKIEAINNDDLSLVMDLLKVANTTMIYDMISEINISEKNNVRIITLDGSEVLLGDAGNPAYLMVALDEMFVNLYTKNIKNVIIDMRYEGYISVRDRDTWED
ncbi:MAG TPA: FtsQ-type POTRA domain-containing protein [Oscillospiraceae bacterium]|nr:FtsQ-type POTRA domain-containing protein [Oscillospiraceae bacterium]